MKHSHEELCAILNGQTGKLAWSELEKQFAQGVIIKVTAELDLIEVAAAVVEDNKVLIKQWMSSLKISNADEADAKGWLEQKPEFWGVVAAPWVIIQEIM
ncbi:MAG: DUF2288 domain-containing protein [Gammaproteobacteria bacterium]|nr:DUF2288 domain-containing protein [Gammaproteobacteria bacterium]